MPRPFLLSLILLCWFNTAAQEACSSSYDGNDDGQVGITDLLGLLTVFGDMDLDDDGIWDSQDDCIDLSACNYDLNPTQACKYIDTCGVCGGPGAIYECGCFDKPDGDCDCEGNELDAIGICGGTCELDTNLNGVCDDVEGCSDPAACNYQEGNIDPFTSFVGPCLQLDTHKVHIDGPLGGMITYRMYYHPADEDNSFLTAVWGELAVDLDFLGNSFSGDAPLAIETTSTFFQHPIGGAASDAISNLETLLPFYPELLYDSWVTIGHAPELGPAEASINLNVSPNDDWALEFEAGGDILIDDVLGGMWFILNNGQEQGQPDDDGRILIGQFTTDGEMTATINTQLWGFIFDVQLSTESCQTSDLCSYPDVNGNCD